MSKGYNMKDIAKLADTVGDGVKDVAQKVGDGVKDVASKVADGVKDVANKVADGAKDLGQKIEDIFHIRRGMHVYAKHSYGRTAGKTKSCGGDKEADAGSFTLTQDCVLKSVATTIDLWAPSVGVDATD